MNDGAHEHADIEITTHAREASIQDLGNTILAETTLLTAGIERGWYSSDEEIETGDRRYAKRIFAKKIEIPDSLREYEQGSYDYWACGLLVLHATVTFDSGKPVRQSNPFVQVLTNEKFTQKPQDSGVIVVRDYLLLGGAVRYDVGTINFADQTVHEPSIGYLLRKSDREVFVQQNNTGDELADEWRKSLWAHRPSIIPTNDAEQTLIEMSLLVSQFES